MAVWTVFEPETAAGEAPQRRAQRLVFVREAFSWAALFFAPLVLLAHRLWLATLGYVLLQGLIVLAGALLELDGTAGVFAVLPNLIAAFELSDLRRLKLAGRGFVEIGSVVAADREAAERRFLDGWLPGTSPGAAPTAVAPAVPAGVLGSFPEAIGR